MRVTGLLCTNTDQYVGYRLPFLNGSTYPGNIYLDLHNMNRNNDKKLNSHGYRIKISMLLDWWKPEDGLQKEILTEYKDNKSNMDVIAINAMGK